MKCQECGLKTATAHVKTIVNGHHTEYMLCADCAAKLGYANMFGDLPSEFGNLLGSFFGHALPERTQALRCSVCGSLYNDIAKSGRVGCEKCYEIFKTQLMPSIKNIHGNTSHCGKKPLNAAKLSMPGIAAQINSLKQQMSGAVAEQDFETAAKLRDQIKELEEQQHE